MQGMRQQMMALQRTDGRVCTSKFGYGGNGFLTHDLERSGLGVIAHADDHMLNAEIAQLTAIVDRVARPASAQIHTSDRSAFDCLERPADAIAFRSTTSLARRLSSFSNA